MYKYIFLSIICLSVCWLGSLFLCHYSFGCITLLTFCYSDLNVCTKKMIFFFFCLLLFEFGVSPQFLFACTIIVSQNLYVFSLIKRILSHVLGIVFVDSKNLCVFSNKVILFLCPWNCVCCYNMLELWIIILIALVITG